MALDKLVDSSQLDTDLTSVANAIRAKGGTSAQLAFPAGFVSAVQAIPTGTTPTGTKQISITANGTTTEDVTNYANAEITVNVQSGGDYVAADWLNVAKPVGAIVSDISSLNSNGNQLFGRTKITSVHLTNAASIPDSFARQSSLTKIRADKAATLGGMAFYSCRSLQYAIFPAARNITKNDCFSGCSALLAADFGGTYTSGNGIANYAFNGCALLNVLVLRGAAVMALQNTNALNGTCFASGKAGGTLYVPNDLISSYQSASNWSTILGYPNNQIKSIESTHTDPNAPIDLTLYYVDGTPIPTT